MRWWHWLLIAAAAWWLLRRRYRGPAMGAARPLSYVHGDQPVTGVAEIMAAQQAFGAPLISKSPTTAAPNTTSTCGAT